MNYPSQEQLIFQHEQQKETTLQQLDNLDEKILDQIISEKNFEAPITTMQSNCDLTSTTVPGQQVYYLQPLTVSEHPSGQQPSIFTIYQSNDLMLSQPYTIQDDLLQPQQVPTEQKDQMPTSTTDFQLQNGCQPKLFPASTEATVTSPSSTIPSDHLKSSLKPMKYCRLKFSEHQCDLCGHYTKTKHGLAQHKRQTHSDRVFVCGKCGKKYETAQKLEKHIPKHNLTEKPFKCTVCPQQYHHKIDLSRHLLKHSPNHKSRLKCSFCDKVFFRDDHLRHHESVHMRKLKHKKEQDERRGRVISVS
ncbi:zinc finger protein 319-like [Toxorhynchites rutilus septentrionalis]|uniref:zinc finger protein 319-like n=1 Tax=Toxorhynchites rutilus septentrionalis TaxID=329112 RepID=UPI00247AE9B4|nr:zinc finger protein 319-like [Toxorhynchites rutilus septentrionalis]